MAASLFTFSSTSRRVIPAPNSPPLPIYIKATNVVFNPDIPDVHRGLGLDDFVNFLVSCRLRYAISEVPSEFFPKQVCEFYYTTPVNNENNIISYNIGCGRRSVFINADLLRTALRLPIFEPFSKLPTIERCRRLFYQLGYDHSKAGARPALILHQCMTLGWKFFIGALCKCIGHKSRSGYQLSAFEQQVVCLLLLNKCVDYGAFFFDQLVQLLRANVRADHVPFPRWIALVLDKFYAEAYYSHAGNPIQCPRMSVRMYQDDPLANDIVISDRMREWIVNPYTIPSLNADTDEGAADNDEINAEIQEGCHISPQLSHHTISVTERVHSAHGESSAQGEQPSQGDQPSQGEQHRSQEIPGTQLIQIPASAFNELLTLTRDMSQRLLRIEADVNQLKGVILSTPSPCPNDDDDQKGGETDSVDRTCEHGSRENIVKQTKPSQPEHESERPAETEKPTEECEHDDECQTLDMNFIDPTVPVQASHGAGYVRFRPCPDDSFDRYPMTFEVCNLPACDCFASFSHLHHFIAFIYTYSSFLTFPVFKTCSASRILTLSLIKGMGRWQVSINVWMPVVTDPYEFNLSQLRFISGSFSKDLNSRSLLAECVGEDIEDLEHTPKAEFEGYFKVTNVIHRGSHHLLLKALKSKTRLRGEKRGYLLQDHHVHSQIGHIVTKAYNRVLEKPTPETREAGVTSNMHFFDSDGMNKKYDTPEQSIGGAFEGRIV
ncbi:unnamed protein product [Lactuca saligna]|uniref:Uncharacterized protein n=1 Tax=Lactuca saligna TaxID=75948 RepID=A0AA35VI58_LACSI|nr:unnamed protein product [Lactuca saligna]